MEIKISNKKYSVTIDDESNINEMMDGIVAALILEEFAVGTIYEGLIGKAESMEQKYGLKYRNID